MRRQLRTAAAALAAFTIALLGLAAPAQGAGHNPVVFVHGYWGSDWNWDVMVDRFRADGWSDSRLHVWDYDTGQSNVTTARQLSRYVDEVLSRTGAAKVDVVTHSMGGLSSRHYLKFLGGTAKVDEWVSLGGPNHGTNAAYGCWDTSCHEMRYDSTFLTNLNSGDETPGYVRYGTVRSYCDEVINPDTSTVLSGAYNRELSGCVGHVSLLGSREAYTTIRDFIR
jgi:Predicted acetyltransferases and hydrolases with the alpha/beta hydrolase fold